MQEPETTHPKATSRDTCRLVLTIRDVEYRVRPVRPTSPGVAIAWRLRRADGTTHVVSDGESGPACDCPDAKYRHGHGGRGCKHIRALRSVGLIDRHDGGAETWPPWTDQTRYTPRRPTR